MPARLALRSVHKRFGTTTALAPLTLDLPAGSVHGVLGENGAGKSTLVRIIAGTNEPDGGAIMIDGRPLDTGDPRAARAAGIGVVHQHCALVGALSVAENLYLGHPEATGTWLAPRRLAADARRLADHHGIAIGDPSTPCNALPVGTQARVEILRALSGSPRVLLLDEPTAVLTPPEVEDLFGSLRRLRDQGLLVIFITHKIAEALAICDHVSVLCAGRLLTTLATDGARARDLASLMVGGHDAARPSRARPPDRAAVTPDAVAPPRTILEVRNLATRERRGRVRLENISFEIVAGEILGIAGVDGNGQDELVAALAGLDARRGAVVVAGAPLPVGDVAAAQRAGVAVIPADRRRDGLALDLPLWENTLLAAPVLARFSHRGLVERRRALAFAKRIADDWHVVHADLEQPIGTLSGGNQQRLVIGRTLAGRPRVLLAVNPTRGLDITAAARVHTTLQRIAADGAAVLVISTDLDELATLTHRAFALFRGRLHGPLAADDRTELGARMAGIDS